MSLPLNNWANILKTAKQQIDEDLDELILGAELIGSRPNYLMVDENGFYHIQASGTLSEVTEAMGKLQDKLDRIRKQKDN